MNPQHSQNGIPSGFLVGSWDMGVLKCFGTLKQRLGSPNLVQIVKTFKILQNYITKMGSHIQIKI
jgi:hypothetical protein